MGRDTITSVLSSVCRALDDMGAAYEFETDNRGGNRSAYVFVRKPLPAKIRISDHRSSRIDRDKARMKMLVIDVDVNARGFGVAWQEAVAQVASANGASA